MSAVAENLKELIKILPGYDPYRDAEGFYFDETRAQSAIDLYESHITHVKGALAGKPYELANHEKAILANLFGWYGEVDGLRRYRTVFYFVPRKNSKTTFSAGVATLVLFYDNEPGAENYCVAADATQARILHEIVKGMIRNNDELTEKSTTYKNEILNKEMPGTTFQVLSSSADTKHGQNAHWLSIDELHVLLHELIEVLTTSQGARRQPVIFYTTTSDYERESACNDEHNYASSVRDGVIHDPRYLPVIYEATIDDDWTSPEVWAKANPNLGRSVSLDFIRSECERAKQRPIKENTFKRLYLNIRTEQESRWLPMDKWDGCSVADDPGAWRRASLQELRHAQCFAGLDLGSTSDLTALALLFEVGDGVYKTVPYFWVSDGAIKKKKHKYRILYESWISDGFVQTTPGDVTDYDRIRADINELADYYGIQSMAVDRLYQGAQLCTQLQEDGFNVVAWPQTVMGMTAPSKMLEELVIAGKIDHGNNPVLRWMAANTKVYQDGNENIKPMKPKSDLKIDGIVALIMALGLKAGQQQQQSYYDRPDAKVWL